MVGGRVQSAVKGASGVRNVADMHSAVGAKSVVRTLFQTGGAGRLDATPIATRFFRPSPHVCNIVQWDLATWFPLREFRAHTCGRSSPTPSSLLLSASTIIPPPCRSCCLRHCHPTSRAHRTSRLDCLDRRGTRRRFIARDFLRFAWIVSARLRGYECPLPLPNVCTLFPSGPLPPRSAASPFHLARSTLLLTIRLPQYTAHPRDLRLCINSPNETPPGCVPALSPLAPTHQSPVPHLAAHVLSSSPLPAIPSYSYPSPLPGVRCRPSTASCLLTTASRSRSRACIPRPPLSPHPCDVPPCRNL